jgi:aspartate/methionine/tyrosine aminotransferase
VDVEPAGYLAAAGVAARGQIPPFYVMHVVDAVGARRRAGLPVVDLSAGQPSTPAPAAVREAAARAARSDLVGYTNALGIPPLREAISGHYANRYGLHVDPEAIVITTGSSGAFLFAFLAAFDAGDVVAVARPGYPAYRNMLSALGCTVVELDCAGTRFQPTIAQLRRCPNRRRVSSWRAQPTPPGRWSPRPN